MDLATVVKADCADPSDYAVSYSLFCAESRNAIDDERNEYIVGDDATAELRDAALSPMNGKVSSAEWAAIRSTVVLHSGEEYAAPSTMGQISCDDFDLLC